VLLDRAGPRVVDVQAALAIGIARGLFREGFAGIEPG